MNDLETLTEKFNRQQFIPLVNEWALRIAHYGGDYGNFVSWFLQWLIDPEHSSIEQILLSDGSAHGTPVPYLQRDLITVSDSKYIKYTLHDYPGIFSKSILRLHLTGVGQSPIDEVTLLSKQGPTLLIDPDLCIEVQNNRIDKMPKLPLAQETNPVAVIHNYNFYRLNNIPIHSIKNLYVVSVTELTTNTYNTLEQILRWWGNHQMCAVRSKQEILDAVAYWHSKQQHIGKDQLICDIANGVNLPEATLTDLDRSFLNLIKNTWPVGKKITPHDIVHNLIRNPK